MTADGTGAGMGPNARRYVDSIVRAVEADLGGPLPAGTTIVPADERTGSQVAVAYELPGRTAIWCDPAIAAELAPLAAADALTAEAVIERSRTIGAEPVGTATTRVLDGPLRRPEPIDGYREVSLDRDRAADRALIAAFIAESDEDDLDDAELDIDELDPAIVVLLAGDGRIASYASERPAAYDEGFDDIAVTTHPRHRREGLGVRAVAALVERRPADARFIYRCDVDNPGSNRIAESLGFTPVVRVAGITLGPGPPSA